MSVGAAIGGAVEGAVAAITVGSLGYMAMESGQIELENDCHGTMDYGLVVCRSWFQSTQTGDAGVYDDYDDYDDYDENNVRTGSGGKGGGSGKKRPDNTNKQVDEAARAEGLDKEDIWEFRRFVEDRKQSEGRGNSDNYTYKELRRMANEWKNGSR